MTKLYLIRHAEAEGNIYRRMHGQYDALVTRNGLRQIDALRKRFESIPIDAVFASDLWRTRKTAEALCQPKALPLHPDPRFREVGVGCWEDRPFGALEREFPGELELFNREPERWQVAGAEGFEQFTGRFLAGLRELAIACEGQSVAVFTHGCVLSASLHRLLGIPHDTSLADNSSVSLLEYDQGAFRPAFLFDNSHLSEAISTRAQQRWWRRQGGRFNLWYRQPLPEDAALYDPLWRPEPGDRVWIAMLGETAVGYLALKGRQLRLLWLRPEYRHRRMGDQLLGQAISVLRSEGTAALELGVPTAELEAVAFLSRHASPVQMDDCYAVFHMEIRVN